MSLRAMLVLVIVASPVPALASSALILPRTGGSGASVDAAQRVVEATRRVLVNDGWTLYDLAEVSTGLAPHLAACGPDDRCAHELRSLIRVNVAVGLRVWGDGDTVERIAVVFVSVRGAGHRALVEVDPEVPLEFAVAEAVRAAATAWSTGATGEMPGGRSIAPGVGPETEASPLNFAIGTLLALGSAPLLGYGINTAVRHGDCVTEIEAGCVERIEFRDGTGVFTGLGVALLLGVVVAFATQPIRVTVYADPESARLVVGGRF